MERFKSIKRVKSNQQDLEERRLFLLLYIVDNFACKKCVLNYKEFILERIHRELLNEKQWWDDIDILNDSYKVGAI